MNQPHHLLREDMPFKHVGNAYRQSTDQIVNNPLLEKDCNAARAAISAWPGYSVSPLLELRGIADRISIANLYYKDEADRFGLGSFKALGGAYAVSVILLKQLTAELGRPATLDDLTSGKHRNLTQKLVVSCATDGNHGRSVAWGAQRFGCECIIYIHSDVSEGRKQAIEHYGATVIRVTGNYDESVRIAAEEADKNGRTVVSDTSYPGYTDIPADVMRGYTVLADEAMDQLDGTLPTHVFLQGGVGGFAAAVAARVRARCEAAQPRIVVVEPDQADCIYESIKKGSPVAVRGELDTVMAGLAFGEVSVIAFELLLKDIDDVLVLPDESAIDSMRFLAKGVDGDPPLVAGESSVTGLAGLVFARQLESLSTTLELDKNSRILVIGTEGATDSLIYQQIVGYTAEEINQRRIAHAG